MVHTIPAGMKSANCIFKLDVKISNFTRGYTILGADMVEIYELRTTNIKGYND